MFFCTKIYRIILGKYAVLKYNKYNIKKCKVNDNL